MISARCTNLIRELAMLQWPENIADKKDESVKPLGSDHALDALAYLVESERSLLQATTPVYGDELLGIGEWRTKPTVQPTKSHHSAGYWD